MEVAKDSMRSTCDNVSCVKDSGDDAMKCQSDWGFLSQLVVRDCQSSVLTVL